MDSSLTGALQENTLTKLRDAAKQIEFKYMDQGITNRILQYILDVSNKNTSSTDLEFKLRIIYIVLYHENSSELISLLSALLAKNLIKRTISHLDTILEITNKMNKNDLTYFEKLVREETISYPHHFCYASYYFPSNTYHENKNKDRTNIFNNLILNKDYRFLFNQKHSSKLLSIVAKLFFDELFLANSSSVKKILKITQGMDEIEIDKFISLIFNMGEFFHVIFKKCAQKDIVNGLKGAFLLYSSNMFSFNDIKKIIRNFFQPPKHNRKYFTDHANFIIKIEKKRVNLADFKLTKSFTNVFLTGLKKWFRTLGNTVYCDELQVLEAIQFVEKFVVNLEDESHDFLFPRILYFLPEINIATNYSFKRFNTLLENLIKLFDLIKPLPKIKREEILNYINAPIEKVKYWGSSVSTLTLLLMAEKSNDQFFQLLNHRDNIKMIFEKENLNLFSSTLKQIYPISERFLFFKKGSGDLDLKNDFIKNFIKDHNITFHFWEILRKLDHNLFQFSLFSEADQLHIMNIILSIYKDGDLCSFLKDIHPLATSNTKKKMNYIFSRSMVDASGEKFLSLMHSEKGIKFAKTLAFLSKIKATDTKTLVFFSKMVKDPIALGLQLETLYNVFGQSFASNWLDKLKKFENFNTNMINPFRKIYLVCDYLQKNNVRVTHNTFEENNNFCLYFHNNNCLKFDQNTRLQSFALMAMVLIRINCFNENNFKILIDHYHKYELKTNLQFFHIAAETKKPQHIKIFFHHLANQGFLIENFDGKIKAFSKIKVPFQLYHLDPLYFVYNSQMAYAIEFLKHFHSGQIKTLEPELFAFAKNENRDAIYKLFDLLNRKKIQDLYFDYIVKYIGKPELTFISQIFLFLDSTNLLKEKNIEILLSGEFDFLMTLMFQAFFLDLKEINKTIPINQEILDNIFILAKQSKPKIALQAYLFKLKNRDFNHRQSIHITTVERSVAESSEKLHEKYSDLLPKNPEIFQRLLKMLKEFVVYGAVYLVITSEKDLATWTKLFRLGIIDGLFLVINKICIFNVRDNSGKHFIQTINDQKAINFIKYIGKCQLDGKISDKDRSDLFALIKSSVDKIKNLKGQGKKKKCCIKLLAAKRYLDNIIKSTGNVYVNQISNLSTKQLLILIYCAIRDNNYRIGSLDDAREAIIQACYEIQRGYNIDINGKDNGLPDDEICKKGAFNKLISTFTLIIPCCKIVVITPKTAALKLPCIVKEIAFNYLEKQSNSYQILQNLKRDGIEAIWKDIKPIVADCMFEEFGVLYGIKTSPNFVALIENGIYTNIQDAEIEKFQIKISQRSCGIFTQQPKKPAKNPDNDKDNSQPDQEDPAFQ